MQRAVPWLVALFLVSPAPAQGYVRGISKDGTRSLAWLQSCIVLEPDGRGGPDITGEQLAAALERAVDRWNQRASSCSYLDLSSLPASGPRPLDADDGRWVVGFAPRWGDREGETESTLAITGSQHINNSKRHSGEVLDADIRLNARDFTFTVDNLSVAPRAGTQLADLEYVLTHEIGHALGFGHSCWIGENGQDRTLVDDRGQPIPACLDLPAGDPRLASVMFPAAQAAPGWQISDDDARGVCTVYTREVPAIPACHRLVTGGCSTTGAGDVPLGPLGAILLIALAVQLTSLEKRW